MNKTILVTGSSGFIGSFIVEEGLKQGYDVWAGIRGTSSRRYLQDKRIQFAQLDMQNPEKLRSQLLDYKEKLGGKGWDYVIHAAGATKCLHLQDFYRTNTEGTKNLISALRETDMVPQRFVFLSSFGMKPMHIFGFIGTLMFIIGFIAIIIVGAIKVIALCQHVPHALVTDNPYFYISLTMMMLGTQLFVGGFLGDLISRNSQERNKYQVEKEI